MSRHWEKLWYLYSLWNTKLEYCILTHQLRIILNNMESVSQDNIQNPYKYWILENNSTCCYNYLAVRDVTSDGILTHMIWSCSIHTFHRLWEFVIRPQIDHCANFRLPFSTKKQGEIFLSNMAHLGELYSFPIQCFIIMIINFEIVLIMLYMYIYYFN